MSGCDETCDCHVPATVLIMRSQWDRRHPDPFATVAKPRTNGMYLDACDAAIASSWATIKAVEDHEIGRWSSDAKAAGEFIAGARAGAAVLSNRLGYEVEPDQINKLLGLDE